MRFVKPMSLRPALDRALSGNAFRCLVILRSHAGRRRMFRTLTCSLAQEMGVTTNTIRNYRDELVRAGYIHWLTDRKTGITTIMLRTSVEYAADAPERAPGPWPRTPKPKNWRFPGGGAKFPAHINQIKRLELVDNRGRRGEPQPPTHTPEEYLAIARAWAEEKEAGIILAR